MPLRPLVLSMVALCAAPTAAQRVLYGTGEGAWTRRLEGVRQAQLLRAQSQATREAAARALAEVGDPAEARIALLEALQSERASSVRSAIAASLAWRAHPESLDGLIEAFDSARDPEVHGIAMAILAVGTPEALRVLVEGLGRADLAAASQTALARAGLRASPHLMRHLRQDPLSTPAIELLGQTKDPEAVPLLVRLSRSEVPVVRASAIRALGRVGDPRARNAVARALDDEDEGVVAAAWEALPIVGGPQDAARVEAELAEGAPERRRLLLETLLSVNPVRGVGVIVDWVTSDDPNLVRIAGDLALERPSPALVSVLYGLFQEGTRKQEAAAALAEVEGGMGLSVLLREVGDRAAQRELAVGVRRWRHRIDRAMRRAAHRAFRDGYARAEGAERFRLRTLRALALDNDIESELEAGLRSEDAVVRTQAAYDAMLLRDRGLSSEIKDAWAVEADDEAWRMLTLAALELRIEVPARAVLRALNDPDRAPEAALLAGNVEWNDKRPDAGRRLREMMRAPDARTRACAVWGIAAMGEASAWRALMRRLTREDETIVRRAAARALARLAPSEAAPTLARRARVEADDEVRRWLLRSASGASPSTRGRQVLRFRVVTATPNERVPVDITLHDGRWLRMHTLPTGELFLAGLPESSANVRVRVASF